MKKNTKAYPGAKAARIHNPGVEGAAWSLGLPKGAKKMANKNKSKKANSKKKGGKKGKKRNTGSAATSSSSKVNGSKKRNSKKASASKKRNPLPSLGDVTLAEWGTFALAAIGSRSLTSLIANPDSYLGIGIQIGLTLLSGKFAPKSVRTAATFGAGGGAVVSIVNRFTNNAIPNLISKYVGPYVPQQLAASNTAAATQTGLSGPRRYPSPIQAARGYQQRQVSPVW